MRSQLHRSDESIRSHIIRNGVHHVFAHLSTMSPVYTGAKPSENDLWAERLEIARPEARMAWSSRSAIVIFFPSRKVLTRSSC